MSGNLDAATVEGFGEEWARFEQDCLSPQELQTWFERNFSVFRWEALPKDAVAAIASCARKLKPGAPLLLYLHYRFDNRPAWFQSLWKLSDLGRSRISRMFGGAVAERAFEFGLCLPSGSNLTEGDRDRAASIIRNLHRR
ncbi:MAG: hypothetical protein AMXMBFR34_26480 [Myxococcaceae bacterium]